jgi:hypothetical protein
MDKAGLTLIPLSDDLPRLRRWLHAMPFYRLRGLHPVFVLRRLRREAGTRLVLRLPCLLLELLRSGAAFALWALRRCASWMADQVVTSVLDALDRLSRQPPSILRLEEGIDPQRSAGSVAVMVQFSGAGMLSEMVLRQIATYRELGFAVVLVSNSPTFPEASWSSARRDAALVVHRRNRGLDFGAWQDLLPVVLERWSGAEELLLVNDSVLGPIHPLAPMVAAMRGAGPGFFGMLESIQGGPHLQSWFMLARGRTAVPDVADFISRLRLSRSKWKIVQRGELRIARAMRRLGHHVAAVYSYKAIVNRAEAAPETSALLLRHPVNPAHFFWRTLAGPAGCPFIKTELVRRNPGQIADVHEWPHLIPRDAPCPAEVIADHLASLGHL